MTRTRGGYHRGVVGRWGSFSDEIAAADEPATCGVFLSGAAHDPGTNNVPRRLCT